MINLLITKVIGNVIIVNKTIAIIFLKLRYSTKKTRLGVCIIYWIKKTVGYLNNCISDKGCLKTKNEFKV
tara:strand:+ start:799 stop:1008 length:210 start_codon:yes stop_codon:yes gene_type:complete